MALRKTLFKYKLLQDLELFVKANEYIATYYKCSLLVRKLMP